MIINTGSELKIPKYEITVQRVIHEDDPSLYPGGVAKEIILTDAQKARYEEVRYRTDLPLDLAESYIFEGEGEIPDNRTTEEKLLDLIPEEIIIENQDSLFPPWSPKNWDRGDKVIDDGSTYRALHDIRFPYQEMKPSETPTLWAKMYAPKVDPGTGEEEVPAWDPAIAFSSGYPTGAKVTNKGKVWENVLTGMANVWEPGTPGIDERYWKEVV